MSYAILSSNSIDTTRSNKRPKIRTLNRNNGVKDMCILCKEKLCLVDHTEKEYPGRVTRRISRWLKYLNSVVINEVYRSMPLLGDEEAVPNWDVHIARYSITFSESYT